jgi:hypothetical protein
MVVVTINTSEKLLPSLDKLYPVRKLVLLLLAGCVFYFQPSLYISVFSILLWFCAFDLYPHRLVCYVVLSKPRRFKPLWVWAYDPFSNSMWSRDERLHMSNSKPKNPYSPSSCMLTIESLPMQMHIVSREIVLTLSYKGKVKNNTRTRNDGWGT